MDARPTPADASPALCFELRLLPLAAGRSWHAELRPMDAGPVRRFDNPLDLLRFLEQAGEPGPRPGHLR
ncbi:MAG: hypothetical protein ABI641_05070 [Caldimonas sp.]